MSVAYYVLFPGIHGDVKRGPYRGWSQAQTISFGDSNGNDAVGFGAGAGRSFDTIRFSMKWGSGSQALLAAYRSGKGFAKVRLVTARTGGEGEPLLEMELTKVTISSFQSGGSMGQPDAGADHWALSFEHVKEKAREGLGSAGVSSANRP